MRASEQASEGPLGLTDTREAEEEKVEEEQSRRSQLMAAEFTILFCSERQWSLKEGRRVRAFTRGFTIIRNDA